MDEDVANRVVELLRERRIFAAVNRRAGVYSVGLRVVIPDGREAIWDNDGAAGLEAMVLRDGVLVGFVPNRDDAGLTPEQLAEIIAETDYDAPPPPAPSHPTAPPSMPQSMPRSAPLAVERARGLFRRKRG